VKGVVEKKQQQNTQPAGLLPVAAAGLAKQTRSKQNTAEVSQHYSAKLISVLEL